MAFHDVCGIDVRRKGGQDGEEVMDALENDVAGVGRVERVGGPLCGKATVLQIGVQEVDAFMEDGVLVEWGSVEYHGEPSAAVEEAVDLVVQSKAVGSEGGVPCLLWVLHLGSRRRRSVREKPCCGVGERREGQMWP